MPVIATPSCSAERAETHRRITLRVVSALLTELVRSNLHI
jgi:hypothetical protein